MKQKYNIPLLPLPYDFETKAVLRQVNADNRRLAELKRYVPENVKSGTR